MKQARLFPLVAFALVLSMGLLANFWSPDLTWFNDHMARDLGRGIEWANLHPSSWLGPEVNFSFARLPGTTFYWMIAACWKLTGSIVGVIVLLHALTFLAACFLVKAVRADFGNLAAFNFLCLFIAMPVWVFVSRTLWNPSLILLFNICLLLLFRAALKTGEDRYVYFFLAVGCLGLFVHFSVFALLFAGAVVLWMDSRTRTALLYGACGTCVLIFILCAATHFHSGLAQGIHVQYGLSPLAHPKWFLSFLKRMHYHFFLTSSEIEDYDLYGVLFHFGRILHPTIFGILDHLPLMRIGMVLLCLFLFSAFKRSRRNWLERVAPFWTLLVFFPLAFYTAKNGVIPYRYGFMLYPLQFLVLGVLFSKLRPRAIFCAFCGMGFLLQISFLFLSYEVMARSGKVFHTADDNLEVPLRYKLSLLGLGESHGPIAHKIRNSQFEWDMSKITGVSVADFIDKKKEDSPVYVDSLSSDELVRVSRGALPYYFEKLHEEDFPTRVAVGDRIFPATHTLLPLWGLSGAEDIEVRFVLPSGRGPFLRIYYDGSPGYEVLQLQRVTVDGEVVPVVTRRPAFQETSLGLVRLPTESKSKQNEIVARFVVKEPRAKYTWLDIFCSRSGRPFFEDKPPTSLKVAKYGN